MKTQINFIDAAHKRMFLRNFKKLSKNIISETTASITFLNNPFQDWKYLKETVSGIYQIQEI